MKIETLKKLLIWPGKRKVVSQALFPEPPPKGGEDYVRLKAIQQWDGKLPTQFIPGAAVPFLNVLK